MYNPADPPMMACGHAANATKTTPNGNVPACVICMCDVIASEPPSLEGRVAKCSYKRPGPQGVGRVGAHGAGVPSARNLAFFEHRPDEATDRFYCGCWGWD